MEQALAHTAAPRTTVLTPALPVPLLSHRAIPHCRLIPFPSHPLVLSPASPSATDSDEDRLSFSSDDIYVGSSREEVIPTLSYFFGDLANKENATLKERNASARGSERPRDGRIFPGDFPSEGGDDRLVSDDEEEAGEASEVEPTAHGKARQQAKLSDALFADDAHPIQGEGSNSYIKDGQRIVVTHYLWVDGRPGRFFPAAAAGRVKTCTRRWKKKGSQGVTVRGSRSYV